MMAPLEDSSATGDAVSPQPRLTSLSHGGGCGCKIAPGLLSEILRTTARMPVPPELLTGGDARRHDFAALPPLPGHAVHHLGAFGPFWMPRRCLVLGEAVGGDQD